MEMIFIGLGWVSISNAAGLTEVLTRVSDTELELTFTGQATANDDINDVASLILRLPMMRSRVML